MKSLFLAHQHSLTAGGGGQQQCTREYREVLEAAGFDLHDVTFTTDHSWKTRIRRKFFPKPYSGLIPERFFLRVDQTVRQEYPAFVFCNLYNFIPFASRLRSQLPRATKLVLLSHGLASVDQIHSARINRQRSDCSRSISDAWIGAMLRTESDGLPHFDHVFCLAAFEAEICHWLGARSVSWVARSLADNFLSWKPTGDRIGCIGTFDHPPNLEGLELFCAALESAGVGRLRLRLVTRSRQIAAKLRARYNFIDDLGRLEMPNELEAEAATWNAFVHPIFCYAMGCSTKVATGLNWGLPVLTTLPGLRGYRWRDGQVPAFNTPEELAQNALAVLDFERAKILRENVIRVARSGPTVTELASQVRGDLCLA